MLGLVFVTIGILAAVHFFIIQPLFFHPLSRIPGPKLCALSSYWIAYKAWSHQRNHYIDELHHRYGSVVRIGPNELSFSDPTYIKDIYVANFDKSSFYANFGWFNRYNLFSSLDRSGHLKRRKPLASRFSNTSVSAVPQQQLIIRAVDYVIAEIGANIGSPLDVCGVFQAMALDVVAAVSFGPNYDPRLVRNHQRRSEVLGAFRRNSSMWFWLGYFPGLLRYVAGPEIRDAGREVRNFVLEGLQTSKLKAGGSGGSAGGSAGGSGGSSVTPTSTAELMLQTGADDCATLAETGDHCAAGYQTTGIALACITYFLSRDSVVQNQLRAELRAACSDGSLPEYPQLAALPLLDAVVREGLRLSTVNGGFPRVVPKAGMQFRGNSHCGPLRIPAGTVVSLQPYTLHRDEVVFPDSARFDPNRWFEKDAETVRMMDRQIMPFGAGARMCLGKNLAVAEIKLALAHIYRDFASVVAPGFSEADMKLADQAATHIEGDCTLLVFEKA